MTSILSKLNPTPSFPSYKGPYEVGTIDLEIPVSLFIDAGFSPLPPSHSDIPTIQFRVFYPAALKGKAEGTQGSATWLPSPRREYIAAYCRFLGASGFLANVLSYIPRLLYYITLPAYAGHRILESSQQDHIPQHLPTIVFSHGLGGTRNTYSYLLASIASQGAVVFSIEHRDGSGPTAFIREPKKSIFSELKRQGSSKIEADGIPQTPSSSGSDSEENRKDDEKNEKEQKPKYSPSGYNRRRIDYTSQAHEISAATSAIRNKQLEIRLWELGVLFSAIQKLNSGWSEEDIDEDIHVSPVKDRDGISKILGMFRGRLEVEKPSSIVWMGHSFGAATITQFVKGVWYWPKFAASNEFTEPLYIPKEQLLKHFHPDCTMAGEPPTVILLDMWCLSLLGDRTRSIWKLPLPGPTMGVLSQQFYKWKENLRGIRHVMNLKGGTFENVWFGDVGKTNEEFLTTSEEAAKDEQIPQMKKFHRSSSLNITPQLPTGLSESDEAKIEKEAVEDDSLPLQKTQSIASASIPGQPDRKLYYATTSAHLSQSDFGILFPRSARYMVKVDDSERILDLNIRAVTEFIRQQGRQVASFSTEAASDKEIFGDEPVPGWELVSLELGDEGLAKKLEEKLVNEKEGDIDSKSGLLL